MSRVGIVAEGGGTKAAYSAGVLKCLLEHDIVLPYCVGISAGTEILLSYVSKQVDRLEVTGIDAPCQKGVLDGDHSLKKVRSLVLKLRMILLSLEFHWI